jgi:photosystem II stability/assembly factor-like uncharacterized protein
MLHDAFHHRALRATAVALCLTLLAACAAAAGPEDESPINAFAFADADTGVAVGDGGRILITADAGLTWKPAFTGIAEHLVAATMSDARTAYAVGGITVAADGSSRGVLLKSVDAGATWRVIGPETSRYLGVSARGQTVVAWCLPCPTAPCGLVASRDGGDTWGPAAGDLRSPLVAFRWTDDESGDALAADGTAWRWDKNRLAPLAPQNSPGRLVAAHLVSASAWVAVREDGRPVITRDAGRSWQEGTLPDTPALPSGPAGRAVSFGSPTAGVLAGLAPHSLLVTADAGRSWKAVAASPAGPLRAAWFRDAWTGLAAGPFGTVHRTADGGATWKLVTGAPRRAGLIVAEPYGSVANWPLVSMLAADRGRRTLLWWVTRPTDDYLLVRERRLRDAAFALGGVEAMIAGPQASSRVDGPMVFDWPRAMPAATFDGSATADDTAALLAAAVRAWRPAAVLSTSDASSDAEEAFVGRAAAAAMKDTKTVRHWTADPQNHTGTRLPGAEGPYEVSVGPATASEEHGVYHGVRAQAAAALARQWPSPVAESLGYHRVGATDRDTYPVALLADLERLSDPETFRNIGATARYGLRLRLRWEQEATAYLPQFKVDLSQGDFASALRRATEFRQSQGEQGLGDSGVLEVMQRAAAAGDLATADRAALAVLARGEGPALWPWFAAAVPWYADYLSATGLPGGAAHSGAVDLNQVRQRIAAVRQASRKVAAAIVARADMFLQDVQRERAAANAAETVKALARVEELAADPRLARQAAFERWLATGREGKPPLPVLVLHRGPASAAPESDEKSSGAEVRRDEEKPEPTKDAAEEPRYELALADGAKVTVREKPGLLIVEVDEATAAGLWLAVDSARDGRTLLAEPLTVPAIPDVVKDPKPILATADAPVWFRRPAAWTRDRQDKRLALALKYDAVGGRPGKGALWILSVRREPAPGARPTDVPGDAGRFAVEFQ